MTRFNTYLQRAVDRNKAAARKAGLHVTSVGPDGTVHVSAERPPPTLTVVPPATIDPRSWSMDIGFVYFISDGEFIKIGFAGDWRARRRDLQVANARPLRPLLVLEGGGRMEKHLHWLFRAHRVAGEWFRPAPELLAYIEEHRADGLPLDGTAPA